MATPELRAASHLNAVYGGGTISKVFLKEALDLTGAERPRVVIAATPKQNIDTFRQSTERMTTLFGELGVQTQILHGFNEDPLSEYIEWADLISVSGGNTARLMEVWARTGTLERVRAAAHAGRLVMSGVSAGAIVGFKSGYSDSDSYTTASGEAWNYKYVDGLHLIKNTVVTPHFDKPDTSIQSRIGGRKEAFIRSVSSRFREFPDEAYLGIDNRAAVRVTDGYVDAIRVAPEADVYSIVPQEDGSTIVEPLRR